MMIAGVVRGCVVMIGVWSEDKCCDDRGKVRR